MFKISDDGILINHEGNIVLTVDDRYPNGGLHDSYQVEVPIAVVNTLVRYALTLKKADDGTRPQYANEWL